MRLSVPDRVFMLPPIGLGDFIAWLPFLRNIQVLNSNVQFFLPARYQPMAALYEAGLLSVSWVSSEEQDELFNCTLALCLNDEEGDYQAYSHALGEIQARVGLGGGRFRANQLTYKVASAVFGFPRHESQRNLRLLRLFRHNGQAREDGSLALADMNISFIWPEQSLNRPYVVLHPYSNGHAREWPLKNFIELAKRLVDNGYLVVLTGSHDEQKKLGVSIESFPEGTVNLCGRLDLKQLLQVLNHANLVVAASTGPLHLAAALGIKTLGLFVPRKGMGMDRWGPVGLNAYSISDRKICRAKSCDAHDCACMQKMHPELIACICLRWLALGKPELTTQEMPYFALKTI